MVSTRVSLLVLGVNPLQRSDELDSRMGTAYGIYLWVSTLVMGNLMGSRFVQFVFAGRHEVPNIHFNVIYYIMSSGGFVSASSDHHVGAPGPRDYWQTRALLEELHLVPPRTPRRSGYGVLCTYGLCYMLFLLYV
jgi:hypothetical protein